MLGQMWNVRLSSSLGLNEADIADGLVDSSLSFLGYKINHSTIKQFRMRFPRKI